MMTITADDVLRTLRGIPEGDTSIDARVLADALEARRAGYSLADLLNDARRESAIRRRSAALFDEPGANQSKPGSLWRKGKKPPLEAVLQERTVSLLAEMAGDVQSLRVAVLGPPGSTLTTLEEGERWIEANTPKPPTEAFGVSEQILDAVDTLNARVDDHAWLEIGVALSRRSVLLEYWTSSGNLNARHVNRQDKPALASLARWSERMSQQTSIPAASLVAHVLVGLIPGRTVKLSNGTATMPGLQLAILRWERRFGGRRALVIEIDLRDLSDRHLKVVRQQADHFVGQHRPPRLTRKQQRIVDLVKGLGGPPRVKYDTEFWQRVTKGLPKQDRLEDLTAIARRYHRAVKALSTNADAKTSRR